MTALSITPLHDDFGARIDDIDLAGDLSADDVSAIHAAIDRYSFLCFPGQKFNDDLQLQFTKRLGEPEESHVPLGEKGIFTYFGTIGNVQPDGTALKSGHKRVKFATGNYMWHSDSSFRKVPSYVSIMCAYEVPDEGGHTEFVSGRAAYRRLPEPMKQTVEPLVAVHDYVFSRSKIGADVVSPSLAKSLPPVEQKLVRKNPNNAEKNIYVGSHAKTISGWEDNDARALLDDLLDRATQPQHVYEHRWQPHDLVIWDNRCLIHRGSGYDADRFRRYMRQTRVRGAGSSLQEA